MSVVRDDCAVAMPRLSRVELSLDDVQDALFAGVELLFSSPWGDLLPVEPEKFLDRVEPEGVRFHSFAPVGERWGPAVYCVARRESPGAELPERPVVSLAEVAGACGVKPQSLSSAMSRDRSHWLRRCRVRGLKGKFHTHRVREHFAGGAKIEEPWKW